MVNTRVVRETLRPNKVSRGSENGASGVQALFGFSSSPSSAAVYCAGQYGSRALLFSLLLVTFAIGLLMAPAAMHRLSGRKCVSDYLVDVSSKLLAASMPPLALAIALDVYLVARLAFDGGDRTGCAVIGGIVLSALLMLWFIFPLYRPSALLGGGKIGAGTPDR
jgi:hypothetical protein